MYSSITCEYTEDNILVSHSADIDADNQRMVCAFCVLATVRVTANCMRA